MEIEAKFRIPHPRVARALAALPRVGAFTLGPARVLTMRDTFYDTPRGELHRTLHVLRVRRRSDGATIITLKGMTDQKGAVHSRSEFEETLRSLPPGPLPLDALPEGALKRELHRLVPGAPLRPFLRIHQTRAVRSVRQRGRIMAEWSVDRVQFRANNRRRTFHELEIELKNRGTRRQLDALLTELHRLRSLSPVHQGKFQRALHFARAVAGTL